MSNDNDHILELVQKIQTGDQIAFAAIYDQYAQRLYAFIRIKVAGTHTAEDILQEVFLKVWRGCRSLDLNNLNFSAWLYKVTSNTINDYYRKKYREPQTTSLEEAAELADTNYTANPLSAGLSKQVMAETMDKLPAHYKEVIELRFMQDFSVQDTAEILGKNSITVRVWQHRALKQLHGLFKKYGQSAQEIL
jgi:RNA polymerase sigma-70 factor (ECF subfamily)